MLSYLVYELATHGKWSFVMTCPVLSLFCSVIYCALRKASPPSMKSQIVNVQSSVPFNMLLYVAFCPVSYLSILLCYSTHGLNRMKKCCKALWCFVQICPNVFDLATRLLRPVQSTSSGMLCGVSCYAVMFRFLLFCGVIICMSAVFKQMPEDEWIVLLCFKL